MHVYKHIYLYIDIYIINIIYNYTEHCNYDSKREKPERERDMYMYKYISLDIKYNLSSVKTPFFGTLYIIIIIIVIINVCN